MSSRRRSPVTKDPIEAASCSHELKVQIVRNLPFFARLDSDAVRWAASFFTDRGFDAGETIFVSRSESTHLYAVAVGAVKLIHETGDGREVIVDILGPGEFFGNVSESRESRRTNTALALTSICALVVNNAGFETILGRFPNVALDLFDAVSSRLEAAQETIRRLATDDASKRIAESLVRLAGKFGTKRGPDVLIELPLSREDLAAFSGTNPETASRVVSRFRREGIIETGRKWLSIKDENRLSAIAEQ